MNQKYFCRKEELAKALFDNDQLPVYDAQEGETIAFHGFITSIAITDSPKVFLVSFSNENNKHKIVAL